MEASDMPEGSREQAGRRDLPADRVSRRGAIGLAFAGVLAAAGCGSASSGSGTTSGSGTQISVALDWTPNTNHSGMYVAQQLGYYTKRGISLKIIPYASTAPETLISRGTANFGFSYQAGTAYARAAGEDVTGVFAPAQKGLYVIAVRASATGITSPKDLDGKTYAGFGSPDEIPEMKYVISRAGGTGTFTDVTLNTDAYTAVYSGQADFTIAESSWEVIQAKLVGKPLKTFDPTSYGFPDSYSTLISTSDKFLAKSPTLARNFLAATAEGYAYAAKNPNAAAALVIKANPGVFSQTQLVYDSEKDLADGGYLTTASGQVGTQSDAKWTAYGDFLYSNGLLTDSSGKQLTSQPDWSKFYTNAYLPASDQ
jgi:ABC-type nitrate/sulfonate/bicarbonate transport system substrate-binding protein